MICTFCPSRKAKPRAYHFEGQTALVSTCDNCDSRCRTELALGESKISIPSSLDSYEREIVRSRDNPKTPIPYRTEPGSSFPKPQKKPGKRKMPWAKFKTA